MRRAVILCPLEIERRAIAKAVDAAFGRATASSKWSAPRVMRTGPGPGAMAAAVRAAAGGEDKAWLVVLAGLAGGLRVTAMAPPIKEVMDVSGTRWTPTFRPAGIGEAVTLLGVDDVVTTKAEKRSLWERTDAQLVDCESHAFARACTEAGVRWSVVRGVSDGPDDTLPPKVVAWVDGSGRTRGSRVLADLARDPRMIPEVMRIAKRSKAAMEQAAKLVVRLVHAECSTIAAS